MLLESTVLWLFMSHSLRATVLQCPMNEAGSSLNLDNWADRQVYWGEKTRKLLFETILKGVALANRDNFA